MLAIAVSAGLGGSEVTNLDEGPSLEGEVVVEVNGEEVTSVENVMLDGERIIRQQVSGINEGSGTSDGFNWIALGAGTDTGAFSSGDSDLSDDGQRYALQTQANAEADWEFVDGLEPQAATFTDLEGEAQGRWELENEFQANAAADVSQTAIEIGDQTEDDTGGPFIDNPDTNTFAATGLERTIPLENNDNLTITWTVTPQNQ